MVSTQNISISSKKSFITGYYSKSDLMGIWGINKHSQFVKMIGPRGIKILEWKEGKMRFTPKQVRKIIELVGPPLKKEEYTW